MWCPGGAAARDRERRGRRRHRRRLRASAAEVGSALLEGGRAVELCGLGIERVRSAIARSRGIVPALRRARAVRSGLEMSTPRKRGRRSGSLALIRCSARSPSRIVSVRQIELPWPTRPMSPPSRSTASTSGRR